MTSNGSEVLQFPPSPFIRRLSERLAYGPLDILDVGCRIGRNALHLAQQGHKVIGIDLVHEELTLAKQHCEKKALFVVADAKNMPFRHQFDMVLMNEVLHQIPAKDRRRVMSGIKNLTKLGGFNVVSDYIGDKPQALNPGELYAMYSGSEWETIEYFEEEQSTVVYSNVEELKSLATIIAVRNG